MAICTFCGKPAEKEVGEKGVCKVCAGDIIKMFEDELKGKPSEPEGAPTENIHTTRQDFKFK